ncbi:MAG TPA: hypothetical protein VFD84_00785 [Candidatus Binatia bacterium]|jgi:predicted RNase H-like nuclease (RuvC/YqgF family)|nr:hypothetical protein [Candidatus Binatia bacterium]
MPARKRPRARARPARPAGPSLASLKREIRRLTAARAADARRHTRQLAAVRRAADRRLAAMVREIAALRHHEARAEALERLLADHRQRIAELEALLEKATPTAIG